MYVVDILCIRDIYIYIILFVYLYTSSYIIHFIGHSHSMLICIYIYRSRRWFWWVYDLHDLKVIRSFWMRSFAWINICISGWLIWLQTFENAAANTLPELDWKGTIEFSTGKLSDVPVRTKSSEPGALPCDLAALGKVISVCFYVACTCMFERCKKMSASGPGGKGRGKDTIPIATLVRCQERSAWSALRKATRCVLEAALGLKASWTCWVRFQRWYCVIISIV